MKYLKQIWTVLVISYTHQRTFLWMLSWAMSILLIGFFLGHDDYLWGALSIVTGIGSYYLYTASLEEELVKRKKPEYKRRVDDDLNFICALAILVSAFIVWIVFRDIL